jgi:protein-disulfide isomerase/uncharacterized membrane protein
MAKSYNQPVKAVLYNRVILALSFAGIFVAGVLSAEKLFNIQLPCGTGGDCAAVSSHSSAYWGGLPVAFYGLAGYSVLALLALIRGLNGLWESKGLAQLGLVFSGIGFAASAYLQYIALGVLGKRCDWCLASAALMTLIFFFSWLLVSELSGQPSEGEIEQTRWRRADQLLAIGGFAAALLSITSTVYPMVSRPGGVSELTVGEQVELVPEGANIYGDKNAPLTLVEFADLSCPTCQRMFSVVKEFVDKYPGRVRSVYRHFPLPSFPLSEPAAAIAEYAADDGKFFAYVGALSQAGEAPREVEQILAPARAAGLNVDEMRKALADSSHPVYKRVERDKKAAAQLGLQTTPTFIVIADGIPTRVSRSDKIFELLQSPEYMKILENR